MADAVSIQVVNLDEFKGELGKLGEAARGEKLVTALKAGALIVENAAKEKCPKRTRTLSRSIHIETASQGDNGAEVDIGTDVVYAAIQEFGGVITPKTAKMLRFEIAGEAIFAHAVTIPAHPYLRPAMDENHDAIQAEITRVLAQLLGASE